MKVVDNFLPSIEFDMLQQTLLSQNFDWYFNDGVVGPSDEQYQFVHQFYKQTTQDDIGGPTSKYANIFIPVLGTLRSTGLVRIKANLNPKTPEHEYGGFHTDFESDHASTAVYYINTNNGWTEFEDGTKVESVENRMVIFDCHMKHTGVTCTDEKRRVVVNFNYYSTWSDPNGEMPEGYRRYI